MRSSRISRHIFMVHVSRVLRKSLAHGQPHSRKVFTNALEETAVGMLLINSPRLLAFDRLG
jgi:hypothetical protein